MARGGVPVFGLGGPKTPHTPSQASPETAILGWQGVWMGPGSRHGGAPGVPSLVFLERLNGKRLADGRPPTRPRGGGPKVPALTPPTPPEPSHAGPGWAPPTRPASSLLAGAQLCRLHLVGGDESANRWSRFLLRGTGRGVAPGCKALAEGAWGGTLASPGPTPAPRAGQGARGCPALSL